MRVKDRYRGALLISIAGLDHVAVPDTAGRSSKKR